MNVITSEEFGRFDIQHCVFDIALSIASAMPRRFRPITYQTQKLLYA
jgi:hypothetical protein